MTPLRINNILVGFDFHDSSRVLLDHAKKQAERTESKIWLVHVAAPEPEFVGYEPGPQNVRDDRAGLLRAEHRYLDKTVNDLRREGYDVDSLLIQGGTSQTLMDKAKELGVDLIILGHHKQGFIFNAFFGSTSAEMLQKSEIPLLVVPLR
jgi:nucleotide-binding universal stress UspA family protein